MIKGTVTARREIVIPLELLSADRSSVTIQAVVDTGFNGQVTLPLNVLKSLGASPAGIRRAALGDGKVVELDVYFANVRWHDKGREVLALQAETTPLVGMSMLWGDRIEFEALVGGLVTIESVG